MEQTIKINSESLLSNGKCASGNLFIAPMFSKKALKNMNLCDFDKTEKLIEFEFFDGEKKWASVSSIFGKIFEGNFGIIDSEKIIHEASIHSVAIHTIKRTTFWTPVFISKTFKI